MNRMMFQYIQYLSIALLFGASLTAIAAPEQINPNAAKLNIGMGGQHTDNINPTFSAIESAQGAKVFAFGQLSARGEGTQYLLDYDTSYVQWQSDAAGVVYNAEPSTVDARIRGLSRLYLSPKWQIDIQAQHHTQEQAYGTGLSRLRQNVLEQDVMTLNSASVSAAYGYDLTERFVALTLGVNQRTYDDINPYAQQFDVTEQVAEVEVGFRLSPASQLLMKLGYQKFDFDQAQIDDSDVYRVLIGASWAPTVSSKLSASVGGYSREFTVLPSRSGFLWNVAYQLTPNDRFKLTIDSKREATATENELSSDSIVSQSAVALSYQYSVRWALGLNAEYRLTEFDDSNRNNDLAESAVSTKLIFSLSSFQSLTTDVTYKNVTSDDNVIDYDQTQIGLFWQYAF